MTKENLITWIKDPSRIPIKGTRMQSVASVYKGGPAKLEDYEIEAIAITCLLKFQMDGELQNWS